VQRDLRYELRLHASLPRDDHNARLLLVGVGPAGVSRLVEGILVYMTREV